MASQQPLVCTSLHLPPDLRPFSRIHEISLHVFLPNLDRLRLALDASRSTNPEAVEIFDKARKMSREQLQEIVKVLHYGQEVAERYSRVLEALSEGNPTHDALNNFRIGASGAAIFSEETQKAMNVFRDEFAGAVRRVSATLDTTKDKKGSKPPLTSTENTQSVSEILSAIDECSELLQQCRNKFTDLATQTQDKDSVDSNPPSEEETQVMRAKWQTFYQDIQGIWLHTFRITNQILYPNAFNFKNASETHKSRQKVPLWRTLFRRQDKRDPARPTNVLRPPTGPEATSVTAPSSSPELPTNAINPLNVTEGQMTSGITEISDAIPPNASPVPVPKIPFWRRFFRRPHSNDSTPEDGSCQQTRSKRWCF